MVEAQSTMGESPIIDFSSGNFVHLGRGAKIVPLATHDGSMSWYQGYGEAHGADGNEGRLVSMWTHEESWDSWEMHPQGHELVMCVGGEVTLIQEYPNGEIYQVTLTTGQAAVNDPGVWHTADIAEGKQATVVYITAGEGTDHRPR